MKRLENEWFKRSTCAGSDTPVASSNLSLDSFWGLFLIAGVASVSALFTFAATFLYQHRHVWLQYDPHTSMWKRMRVLLRIFNQKDMSSHGFRKSEGGAATSTTECSPSVAATQCPPSPFSQSESNFSSSPNSHHVPQEIELR